VTSEQEWVARARQGDGDAIASLYDEYADRIYGYLYRRLGDAQLAEDLTGDVFVRMLEAIRKGQFWKVSFRAWLYRIAHNVLVDYFRGKREQREFLLDERVVGALPADATSGGTNPDGWTYELLREAIRELPQLQQLVLLLRFGEGLKAREVAEVLSKSVGAVEALQHRALVNLRKRMEEQT